MRYAMTILAATAVWSVAAKSMAEPVVELTLLLRSGVSPTAPQRWSEVLGRAGFSQPTIRSARSGDEFGVISEGTERRPIYRVTGYLLSNDSIALPSRSRFGLRDGAGLAKWIRNLKENGIESVTGGTTAFGLTASRLEQVREDLKKVVRQPTKGADATELVQSLTQQLRLPVRLDATAQRSLAVDDPVRDELQTLSTGTALAAILRPAGLVLRPRYQAGRLEYLIADARTPGDNWPVGWSAPKITGQLIPSLFERRETQQVEVPLNAALGELSGAVRVPFLLDHNGMAIRRIDPASTMVMLRDGKSFYGSILRQVLGQAKLQYEPRVDENDKPFLWVTTLRK